MLDDETLSRDDGETPKDGDSPELNPSRRGREGMARLKLSPNSSPKDGSTDLFDISGNIVYRSQDIDRDRWQHTTPSSSLDRRLLRIRKAR